MMRKRETGDRKRESLFRSPVSLFGGVLFGVDGCQFQLEGQILACQGMVGIQGHDSLCDFHDQGRNFLAFRGTQNHMLSCLLGDFRGKFSAGIWMTISVL